MSLSQAPVDPSQPSPVWLVLTAEDPAAPHQLTATVTNVGDGQAHNVTVRKVWRRGLGPSLAQARVVDPESEISLELGLTATERAHCGLAVEWHERGRRRRHHVAFAAFA